MNFILVRYVSTHTDVTCVEGLKAAITEPLIQTMGRYNNLDSVWLDSKMDRKIDLDFRDVHRFESSPWRHKSHTNIRFGYGCLYLKDSTNTQCGREGDDKK